VDSFGGLLHVGVGGLSDCEYAIYTDSAEQSRSERSGERDKFPSYVEYSCSQDATKANKLILE